MAVRLDDRVSRTLWLQALTFRDLCRLGERFVLGEISVFPGWNAPALDVESREIAAGLAQACRAGFLTCASQPARPDQRAFVAGFADAAVARKLTRLSDVLEVRLFGFRDDVSRAEPVSRAEGRHHAFAGHDARADEMTCFEDEIGRTALAELQTAIYVTVFDREWGREDLLWRELARVLELE